MSFIRLIFKEAYYLFYDLGYELGEFLADRLDRLNDRLEALRENRKK